MKSRIIKILLIIFWSIIGVTVVGGGVFIFLAVRSFDSALEPVTDTSRYQEVLTQIEPDSKLIKHFPKKIPQDAKNVRMYFLPGFLQGGTLFQLQMELPAKRIKTLQAQFRKSPKRKYIPGDKKNSSPKKEVSPQGVAVTYEYNYYLSESDNKSNTKFPPNYEILVLEDTRGAPKYDWNHSELYGVAIDVTASKIVYWMEDW